MYLHRDQPPGSCWPVVAGAAELENVQLLRHQTLQVDHLMRLARPTRRGVGGERQAPRLRWRWACLSSRRLLSSPRCSKQHSSRNWESLGRCGTTNRCLVLLFLCQRRGQDSWLSNAEGPSVLHSELELLVFQPTIPFTSIYSI